MIQKLAFLTPFVKYFISQRTVVQLGGRRLPRAQRETVYATYSTQTKPYAIYM
jgi:hypothetical protein